MKEYGYLFKAEMVLAIMDGRKKQTRRIPKPHNCLIDGVGRRKWPDLDWARAEFSDVGCCWDDEPYSIEVKSERSMIVPDVGTNKYYEITPRIEPGDLIWGKETWAGVESEYGSATLYRADNHLSPVISDDKRKVDYDVWRASFEREVAACTWRPSIFMPRRSSRIREKATDVRFEYIQDISKQDAEEEGIPSGANDFDCPNRPIDPIFCSRCNGEGTHVALGDNLGVTEVDCEECDTSVKLFRNLWDSINKERGWGWTLNKPVIVVKWN